MKNFRIIITSLFSLCMLGFSAGTFAGDKPTFKLPDLACLLLQKCTVTSAETSQRGGSGGGLIPPGGYKGIIQEERRGITATITPDSKFTRLGGGAGAIPPGG